MADLKTAHTYRQIANKRNIEIHQSISKKFIDKAWDEIEKAASRGLYEVKIILGIRDREITKDVHDKYISPVFMEKGFKSTYGIRDSGYNEYQEYIVIKW